jgi:ABC-type uncharacterized transport system substrate-binding protein
MRALNEGLGFDPDPTQAGSKSRSAAVSCLTEVCYPFGWKHGRHRAVKRREFITLLGGAAMVWPLAARAQQAGMPVVGFLHAGTPSAFASLVTAFREGLDTAGYVEGRSVAIEYRWAENHYERLPALLTDLVGRRVAVIAALGDGPAATAKAGTSAIPVVVMAASDPVGAGLVGSLNRPGGNITGISMFTSDLMAKRIELLTELVPKATTIGLLVNPTGRRAGADTNEAQAAARALGQQIEVFNAGSADEIDAAFITLVQRRMGALVTGTDVLFTTRYEQIAALASRYSGRSSDLLSPSPPAEKATAGKDQTGQASTGDGARNT